MRIIPLVFISIIGLHTARAQPGSEMNIYFDGAKPKPMGRQVARLDSLLGTVDRSRIQEVTLVGHTDILGGKEGNHALAWKRANSVRELLLERGIPDSLMTVHAHGALVPIAENTTAKGRSKNRRVFVRIELLPDPIVPSPVPSTPRDTCDEDTLIVIDDELRFRAKKCQSITCLKEYKAMSFDEFVESDLRTATPYGDVFVTCGGYRNRIWHACDSDLVFDPPLRVEVVVPPGITASAARDLFGLFGGDGRWLGHGEQNIKVRIKREKGATIAVFSVHRLTPHFSVCCGGVKRGKKVRIRFKEALRPTRVFIYSGGLMAGRELDQKGNTWKTTMPCAQQYRLKVLLTQPDGKLVVAYPDLRAQEHRVQLLGHKCPPMEERGKRLLGVLPTWERPLHRTYIITPATIGPLTPAPTE